MPGKNVADYYKSRAEKQVGLIVIEGTLVNHPPSAQGLSRPNFHCSQCRYYEPEFEGSELNLAAWTKKLSGKPMITVGSVGLDSTFTEFFTQGSGGKATGFKQLINSLKRNEFDLVAVGRALLATTD